MSKKLVRNSARCRNCGDHLVSYHRHDFKVCMCYRKTSEALEQFRIGDNPSLPWDDPKLKEFYDKEAHGIMVDGGNEYTRRGYYNIIDLEETSIYEEDGKESEDDTK